MKYTQEKKEHALALMSAPKNQPVAEVSRQTGVPAATLYLWRKQAKNAGRAVPGDGANPEQWSGADKLAVVLEAAPLGEAELSEYCRRRGLHVEQVVRWRDEAQVALGRLERAKPDGSRLHDKKRIRELERDLRRKEKALAETAALLVLSRKYEALSTDGEDA